MILRLQPSPVLRSTTMKHLLLLPLVSALLGAPGLAQDATATLGGLEAGLEAIEKKNIEADLHFLASDEMGGRDTPSPEQRKAARFLRDRLKKNGFQPGFRDSYLWTYQRERYAVDAEQCSFTLHVGEDNVAMSLGKDYYLRSAARSTRTIEKAGIVYLGDQKNAAKVKAEYDGDFVLLSGKRRPSIKTLRKLFDQGAVGVLILPHKGADKTVAEAQHKAFESMIELTMGKAPAPGRPAILLLTEDAASHLLPKVKGKKPGHRLDETASERCVVKVVPTELENVIGIWPGSDPELRNEVIILSAHYDHVGKRDDGRIYNGADDNASGTTGLLALTEGLKAYGPMRRTIMLQWVSGEEKGLWGSAAWCQDPWFPEGMHAVCNINIDMIGRNAGNELLITPTKKHAEYSWLTKVAEKHRSKEGFKKFKSADDYYHRSDHYNYRKHLNVPVIFLFADVHEDYHQPSDTPDKINYDKVMRVTRLVLRILDGLQDDQLEK